jgi:CofD-related protein of GAK system
LRIRLSKEFQIPNYNKVELYRRAPDIGPSILFFSGGSSLKDVSKHLINYTHNSIHIITPFDSGGSSAALRTAFNMIAVGDLRNRLIALADSFTYGNRDIYRLFTHRFPTNEDNAKLVDDLKLMVCGKHSLISSISGPLQSLICIQLQYFYDNMPVEFDLRGANIGNLLLAGCYLNNHSNIEPALFLFERLVEARGIVKPVVRNNLHLITELRDGSLLHGQHLLTGKTSKPIQSPVKSIYLSQSLEHPIPFKVSIESNIKKLITKADLIVYPMGSFFSSLLVNLIPEGVSDAIAENSCPKVFVPSTYFDLELYGYSFSDMITTLLSYLNPFDKHDTRKLLNYIIIDSARGLYPDGLASCDLSQRSIDFLDLELISDTGLPEISPKKLIDVLLSLV